jgi:glyoxylase-like metal-dependent hydrolase (beta-lactamase superfamily II)
MQLNRRIMLSGALAASAATALAPIAPARAAAPLAGKQNPGWYRYKVGSYEITVVTDGRSVAPLADNYVVNAPKDAVNSVLETGHLPRDTNITAFTPVVVNTGSKLVVIDTGVGLGAYQQSKGAVGQYHTNLAAAGIDTKAVDTVIISHLHADHINGLLGPDNKLAFPNAEVMVPAADWKFWTDDANAGRVPEIAKGQFPNIKRVFGALDNKITQYEAGKELVPGVTAIATPGHTPGHMSHVVASGTGKVLIQADVTAGIASLFLRNPGWHLVWDTDKPLAEQTRRKVYDMATTDKMVVQGFHFPFPGVGYIEKDGAGYRFVPAAWNPML